MQKYTYIYIYWIHTDAMIKTQWQRQTHAVIKTQEDFFNKIFTSHFICKVSKRVTQRLRVRRSWRPNITEIFWPQSYGRQRCIFLVLHGCSTGALESTVLGAGFPYYISSLSTPTILLALLLPLECVTSFRCITLNGIFGRVNRSKHNIRGFMPFPKVLI